MAQQFSYSNQVKSSVNYMLRRLGRTITYKRLQAAGAWSPTGVTDILWEWTSFTSILYDTTTKDIEASGGRLELGDKAFLFLNSVFTDHSDYEYVKFTSGSTEFTAGETITGADDGATGVVINHYEDSGTWSGEDAVGVVWIGMVTGTFNVSENLNGSIGGANMATTTAANTSGGTDEATPRVGDKIIYGNYTYKIAIDEAGGGSIIREDSTATTSTVWGRVVENA